MRIAFITRSAFGVIGGAASYFFPKYVARVADVLVLCPGGPAAREEVVHANEQLDVRNVAAPRPHESVAKVFMALRDFRPDIVHMFHNRWCLKYLYELRRHFPDAKWALDFRSPPIVGSRSAGLKLLWRYFVCQFYVDHLFTHSPTTLGQNVRLRFRRWSELPPGVELAAFRVAEPAGGSPARFVYIGSVARARRLDDLIRGFARFAVDDARACTLDIIGGGDALEPLGRVIRDERAADRVRLAGLMPQHEVYRRLAGYDAGIAWVPGGGFERAPSLKFLEYSAAGLPFAASDTIGHRDYAKRFGFAYVPFENTPEDIAAGLRRLRARGDLRERVAANREAVRAFDWETIVGRDLVPVYERMLEEG